MGDALSRSFESSTTADMKDRALITVEDGPNACIMDLAREVSPPIREVTTCASIPKSKSRDLYWSSTESEGWEKWGRVGVRKKQSHGGLTAMGKHSLSFAAERFQLLKSSKVASTGEDDIPPILYR